MTNGISLPSDGRPSQGTQIEQSRAAAEVQAAVLVAQQCPRSTQQALAAMREACTQPRLAERAFFRFSRAGAQVSGPSITLAKELARCWGNIDYGVSELYRDDEGGQSEMMAYAWDMQSNTRSSTIFIVPHKRDKRSGAEKLTEMRDIYENNANAGARRVRECIFGVIPDWYVDEAKEICQKTNAGDNDAGGKPLAQRVDDSVQAFGTLGVTRAQLEAKVDRSVDEWTAADLAQLIPVYHSLKNGEVSRDDEFPPQRVTTDELIGGEA
ncbi:hypothetical protein [Actinopolyspora halophila]|uniref:hypothetical protein n=1 Tax=Actinopolyspora halophila TaxID=1850 RepID=UPI0003783CE3|nr:hypothetical protein [Actinopolyspora halophila]